MHNHVNTKGIIVNNELKKIQEAEQNSLFEFLAGLSYSVCGLVVVRKSGAAIDVEADPWGWLVAATPLNDELDLLADMCKSYESVVGCYDPTTGGKMDHLRAATLVVDAYKLKKHLLDLGLEYTGSGFVVRLSPEAFAQSPFSWADDETVFTAVGSYAGRLHSCGAVSLTVYI